MPSTDTNHGTYEAAPPRSFRTLWIIVLALVVISTVIFFQSVRSGDREEINQPTFVTKQGPLTISVLESGTIKSREQIVLKNEVEGQTSIISLIPEGANVLKGDLLVELDASSMEDSRIDQEIRVQNAKAAFINATETFAVVENQAESDMDVAQLTHEFAVQDLSQYKEGQFPNEKTNAINEIALKEEELVRARDTMVWTEKLQEKGFISKSQLQADRLAVTRSENSLEMAKNDLKLLENFTYHRQIAQLESDLRQAKMALERTKRKARADVVQAEADLNAKDLEYKRQQDKLQKIMDQIEKAKIYAPVDGMVIYATSAQGRGRHDRREPLDVGVDVRERQELIYLPVASSAVAEVSIHEGSLEKVSLDLPAVVTVDALQGSKFLGRVGRIAPLPDPQSMYMNPDLKVYNTDVYLKEKEPSLRTGMSCKVEIIVEQYEDVTYIPIQAVIRVEGQPTVFIVGDGAIQERAIEIGLDNNRMVHVTSGLSEGEVVLLTPPLKFATINPESRFNDFEKPSGDDGAEKRKSLEMSEEDGSRSEGPANG